MSLRITRVTLRLKKVLNLAMVIPHSNEGRVDEIACVAIRKPSSSIWHSVHRLEEISILFESEELDTGDNKRWPIRRCSNLLQNVKMLPRDREFRQDYEKGPVWMGRSVLLVEPFGESLETLSTRDGRRRRIRSQSACFNGSRRV